MEVKKLLIVDDDPNIFELLRVNFESIGYQILHAADGAEAIAVTNKTPPDLIILDIMIPRIDGYEVCRRLRENDSTSFIPIIVLSAKDQPADKILGLKLGADDYLTKPFNIDELIARVETRLSRTEHYLAANPLTGLPGNVSIMHEVNRRLHASLSFAFLYCDIDHFKPFNDYYNFKRGDDVIRFLADILRKCSGPNDFVGHIGGDDFIMVCDAEKGEARCADIIRMFDNGIPEFYTEEDRKRGGIATKDRRGENRLFPIMTISIGLLTSQRSEVKEYGKLIEIASELKCLAKATDNRGKSLFFKERRK